MRRGKRGIPQSLRRAQTLLPCPDMLDNPDLYDHGTGTRQERRRIKRQKDKIKSSNARLQARKERLLKRKSKGKSDELENRHPA